LLQKQLEQFFFCWSLNPTKWRPNLRKYSTLSTKTSSKNKGSKGCN
jgi:hypothetical protein